MKRLHIFITSIFFTVSLGWFSSASGKLAHPTTPVFSGMENHHHDITTKSPKAQSNFDQGEKT